ncbi:MAG: SecDF P1 head subdomain-containing protein [Acidothermaceae bacterium]
MLSFRQVYRTNMPLAAPLTPDPTGPLQPSEADLSTYAKLDCSLPSTHAERPAADVANGFLVTCGDPDGSPVWYKFVLYPATVSSADVADAHADEAEIGDGSWDVMLDLNSAAEKRWATFTGAHIGSTMAIVINGRVFLVETIEGKITGPTAVEEQLAASDAKALAGALGSRRPAP